MLNLSTLRTELGLDKSKYKSFNACTHTPNPKKLRRQVYVIVFLLLLILFLPWTQTIRSKGSLTSLDPSQRPQTIHSIIPGRIEKWYVQEGDFVKRGDTIMFISEIKDDYFDPNLLGNVQDQILSKESSVKSYMEKVQSLDAQIDALLQQKNAKYQQALQKIKQTEFKIISDSTEFRTAQRNLSVAQEQMARFEELFKKDLISKTELETRKVTLQNAQAKAVDAENKFSMAKNELSIVRTELIGIENEYRDKISKAEADKFSTLSAMYDTEAQVSKLQNQYVNYDQRSGYYYITAPQDGVITKAITNGIGETIKEGGEIVSIMPANSTMAVEMYVDPMNIPLLQKEQRVQFIFDGWPAFVFSGWPNATFGTFAGKVRAIDNFVSPNGKYRVLVVPDEEWPQQLRIGSGADGIALLNDVPIWYEIWRQINGFPPNFYTKPTPKEEPKK
jgi:multidrug efflux pump subunit AcrA (membrane-fusion protein)